MLKALYSFLLMLASLASVSNAQNIIAVGGGISSDDQFIPLLVAQAGGSKANIYIIAAARLTKESQKKTIDSYTSDFISLGVPKENIWGDLILTQKDAELPQTILHLSTATAVCVSGGNQKLFLERIRGTQLHKLILTQISKGCIYYGNSAGTAVIGSFTIVGDDNGHIIVEEGLKLLDNIVLDQHFTERKREWRLKEFLKDHQGCDAVGINENTAVIISKGNKEVIQPKKEVVLSDKTLTK